MQILQVIECGKLIPLSNVQPRELLAVLPNHNFSRERIEEGRAVVVRLDCWLIGFAEATIVGAGALAACGVYTTSPTLGLKHHFFSFKA